MLMTFSGSSGRDLTMAMTKQNLSGKKKSFQESGSILTRIWVLLL